MKTKCKLKINVTFGNLKKYKEIESSIYDLIFSTQDTLEAFVNKNSKHFQKVTSESISCTLHFCGRKKIKKLNKDYRSKNYMTDVLSFPVHENLRHGLDFFCPEISLGDIFICLDYIISNNLNMKNSILEFFVHGFLHLLILIMKYLIMKKKSCLDTKLSY